MDYIEVFFDTCILRTKNIYSEFCFSSKYTDFVDFLGSNDLMDKCKLNFSRIVLKELSKQIVENYENDYENLCQILEKFRSISDWSIEIEKNFIANIDEHIEHYIKNEKGNIIDIPFASTSYKRIIDRAVNKQKPFCGDKGESDKGFKDAIQWESILKYAKDCKSNEFILLTDNKNDFTIDLEREFKDITNKHIRIFKDIGEAQKYILELNNRKSNYDLVKYLLNELFINNEMVEFIYDIARQRNYNIVEIKSIDNIIDLGNDYYRFDLYFDEEHACFYKVDCRLIKSELVAEDIIICL